MHVQWWSTQLAGCSLIQNMVVRFYLTGFSVAVSSESEPLCSEIAGDLGCQSIVDFIFSPISLMNNVFPGEVRTRGGNHEPT